MVVPTPGYTWAPVAAVGTVVGGTGQAVEVIFTGAGAIVGSFLGGVFGGTAALFGSPPSYAYGAPFAAPFNAAGAVAGRRSRRRAALSEGRGRPRRLLSHFRLYSRIGCIPGPARAPP